MLSPRLASPTVSAGLAEQAAAGLVRNHGFGALTILAERAEMADERGHRVAAEAWRRIADAAARLLRVEGPRGDPTRSPPFRSHQPASFRPR